ncbi:MAG: hypothetical protein J6Y30_12270 [Treponema sp.]|nr:hypothetical protein [Treponema sp.]
MTCYYGIENDGEVYVSPSSSKKFKDLPVLSCKSCDEFWMEMQKLPSVKIQTNGFYEPSKRKN